ncbi:MAG: hypothetical protein MJH10_10105 [Epibacterium sp.]|nr:hypothetical protein [Epibacterium sp.]NQX73890.1 hypothetical protein [Epibacterium sp.]
MADVTERGFRIDRFNDAYGVECSLQESSIAADEGHVWFGCSAPNAKILMPGGWVDHDLSEDVQVTTRMHLSQSQMRELLPALQHFAEHGVLPSA